MLPSSVVRGYLDVERHDELEMYATAYSLSIVSTSIVQILNKEQGLERRSSPRVSSNHSVYLLMQDSVRGKINQWREYTFYNFTGF